VTEGLSREDSHAGKPESSVEQTVDMSRRALWTILGMKSPAKVEAEIRIRPVEITQRDLAWRGEGRDRSAGLGWVGLGGVGCLG